MKILWFTNTPSNASLDFGYTTFGGGWISSLETLVVETKIFDLGICFFYNGEEYKKLIKNNVVYYGIPLHQGNAFTRIITRHRAKLNDETDFYFDKVLDDFKPAMIHVFGTEMGYGKILMNKSVKVLFHLQGLVAPYADVYFPPGFNKFQILRNSNLGSIIRGITLIHDYRTLRQRAKREQMVVKYWKYFTGRTGWDRNYIQLMNPSATYFHCEELLRKEFFENEWTPPDKDVNIDKIVIGTTINPNLYKGLDLVYKVMGLLNRKDITWKIFGISENDIYNKIVRRVLKISNDNQRIKFYGQLSAGELIGQLKSCNFFVHPSYIDNSPNSVCEAMMLGIPVISSSVGGVKSLIEDNVTGFLFNPYDKYDLSGILVNLISDYDKAKQAGLKARQEAIRRHSPTFIISDLTKIYKIINGDYVTVNIP